MGLFPEWVGSALMLAAAAGVTLWTAGAVYYDVCGGARWGRAVAAAWVVAVVVAVLVWQPLWQPVAALLGVVAVFLVWWFGQRPRHDRDWDPAVAVLPRAVRDGDTVTVEHVRNFEYRSPTDFDARYETRTYRLANLRGVDIVFFNWGSPWMSHPVMVFDCGPDGRLCFSIEVRYRRGQDYSVVRSLFRQQEMIVVAADERDVILRRTKFEPRQAAHLYRLTTTPDEVRTAFLDYVGMVNRIHARPRWYHGVCANCTTTYYRLPNSRWRLDWRVIANGRLDEALYADGRLDRGVPFADLRRAAYLTDVTNVTPEAGFGDHLRRELERRRHGH
ncbi:lipoprotein N-acyltransferase Lnb domain-containing protein [Urbifossiella limnaea]|uniref:Lnb N-terminal periplasmic domain-containing protein n=1 Tax=Urbifossiella limnaea TaxID=2528023 RepID=A0A517XMP4_9BACT|nr:DUF4105 domain-containing protein [Urbifossiella limnaea]QDU18771.1 hypothetical protein ETAA1_06670 [Urbifossiella limnaea]